MTDRLDIAELMETTEANMAKELEQTRARIAELEAALKWYAEKGESLQKGSNQTGVRRDLDADGGERARKALKEKRDA